MSNTRQRKSAQMNVTCRLALGLQTRWRQPLAQLLEIREENEDYNGSLYQPTQPTFKSTFVQFDGVLRFGRFHTGSRCRGPCSSLKVSPSIRRILATRRGFRTSLASTQTSQHCHSLVPQELESGYRCVHVELLRPPGLVRHLHVFDRSALPHFRSEAFIQTLEHVPPVFGPDVTAGWSTLNILYGCLQCLDSWQRAVFETCLCDLLPAGSLAQNTRTKHAGLRGQLC